MSPNAFSIAKRALTACYDKNGIFAGRKHFDDLWARDHLFAGWGALEIGDTEIVRMGLDCLLKHMRPNGQLPLRVGCGKLGQILKLIGFKFTDQLPTYAQDKGLSFPLDQNSLFLITFAKFTEKTGDTAYLQRNFSALQKICRWNESREQDGLLFGGKYSTWQDSVKKSGWTLFNNILYRQSYLAMAYLTEKSGAKNSVQYRQKAGEIAARINAKFWNGRFYADWYDDKRHDIFVVDGNALAILTGIAGESRVKKIVKTLDREHRVSPFGSQTNLTPYHWRQIYLPYYLLQMHDYQNASQRWLWIGALVSMAYQKAGLREKALRELKNISDVISRHGTVYEVYEKCGKPVKRFFYSSEMPFAWSSGFFLLAHRKVFGSMPVKQRFFAQLSRRKSVEREKGLSRLQLGF